MAGFSNGVNNDLRPKKSKKKFHYRKDLIFLEKIYYDLLIEKGDLSCFRKIPRIAKEFVNGSRKDSLF
jgi:hypothetical protein